MFAKESYTRAARAYENGYFNNELVPVKIEGKNATTVNEDEEYKKVNFDKMASLKARLYKGWCDHCCQCIKD
jgi:acetyl-CoA C-acetyltransferase